MTEAPEPSHDCDCGRNEEIEVRDRSTQGAVLHQFSNATPIRTLSEFSRRCSGACRWCGGPEELSFGVVACACSCWFVNDNRRRHDQMANL